MPVSAIKPLFATATALSITLHNVASSTSNVGQQGVAIDNSTTRYSRIRFFFKNTLGTSPSAGSMIYTLHRSRDGSNFDGQASASAGAYTLLPGGKIIHVEDTKASPATGDAVQGSFVVENPGPHFAIAWSHNTGVNTDSTSGNHWIYWQGENPEAQLP